MEEQAVVAFVRAAGRPCTAEEIITACSLPLTECQQYLNSLVLANQLYPSQQHTCV
jgi:response regulator of citrate/malate metabolism